MVFVSHRGGSADKTDLFSENSVEAFSYFLSHEIPIEFDVNFSKDDEVFIFHDNSLSGITNGEDERPCVELPLKEIVSVPLPKGRLGKFEDILSLIRKYGVTYNALHLKGAFQKKHYVDLLIPILKAYQDILTNLFIFDVTIDTANYIHNYFPFLSIGASVADIYDVKRFNSFTGGTLYTVDEILSHRDIYNWVWLDEWDRKGSHGKRKSFYTESNFQKFREARFSIAVVMPELHASSPSLLGGEYHDDARNMKTLRNRWKEITALKPDACCTDYPELLNNLVSINP